MTSSCSLFASTRSMLHDWLEQQGWQCLWSFCRAHAELTQKRWIIFSLTNCWFEPSRRLWGCRSGGVTFCIATRHRFVFVGFPRSPCVVHLPITGWFLHHTNCSVFNILPWIRRAVPEDGWMDWLEAIITAVQQVVLLLHTTALVNDYPLNSLINR